MKAGPGGRRGQDFPGLLPQALAAQQPQVRPPAGPGAEASPLGQQREILVWKLVLVLRAILGRERKYKNALFHILALPLLLPTTPVAVKPDPLPASFSLLLPSLPNGLKITHGLPLPLALNMQFPSCHGPFLAYSSTGSHSQCGRPR